MARERANLAAAVLAIFVTVGAVAGWDGWTIARERRAGERLAAAMSGQKALNRAWQACVLENPRVLPLYGSSELETPPNLKNRAGAFFRAHPAGFEVSLIGRLGTYPLAMVQQLTSLGRALEGRKVVISVSPSWFYFRDLVRAFYVGSCTGFHGTELAFSPHLSWATKQAIARRLLAYPETLRTVPVTAFALRQLADDSWRGRLAYAAVWPLGRVQTAIMEMQDHFELELRLAKAGALPPVSAPQNPEPLDWTALLEEAQSAAGEPAIGGADEASLPNDAAFLERVEESNQWEDMELLLKVLRELGAKPLLLSNPQNSLYSSKKGYSRGAREVVYQRLRELARRYEVTLLDFAEFDGDMRYLSGRFDHPSDLGWLYYDKALDDFYHDRLGASESPAPQAAR
jgi:D-alanine transfer protein